VDATSCIWHAGGIVFRWLLFDTRKAPQNCSSRHRERRTTLLRLDRCPAGLCGLTGTVDLGCGPGVMFSLVKNCKPALRANSRRQDCVGLELETEIRKYLAEYVLYVDDPFDYDGETSFIR